MQFSDAAIRQGSPFEYTPGAPRPLPRCQACGTASGSLQRCAGCTGVLYCSKPCQTSQWSSHKKTCKLVGARRKAYEDAEDDLRNAEPDPFTPPNVFETSVGHFYAIPETRPYMRARYALTQTLIHLDTVPSLEEALDHGLDMLRLNRSDELGLRHQLPSVMVHLGREQEAYDFVKWWVAHADDESHLKDMPDSPFLDLENANALEPVDLFVRRKSAGTLELHSLALIKIRLLFALQSAEKAVAGAAGCTVQEKIALLEAAHHSSAITRHSDSLLILAEDPKPVVDELARQVREVVTAVHRANKHLLDAMAQPDTDPGIAAASYVVGSREEAHAARSHSLRAWKGTPGALELLASLR
ncbi:hypothetical protein D7B24_007986 [Verticillium nonalfalfae]|uniref:MYND-type domain-containing protein n=1 Tax=Verticillium nonalfalfae TaxID=1051616 RepID=A0A3M9Y5K7_9PEZI|nr:uncharacterized protein D7B24_007986 [Verticillium nonalfalfae]RNJ55789.1 hypothetical protein D7B24_007986 [Verticillium nonalfalfae]